MFKTDSLSLFDQRQLFFQTNPMFHPNENIVLQDTHCHTLFSGNTRKIISQRVMFHIHFEGEICSKPTSYDKTVSIFHLIPKFLRTSNSDFIGKREMKATLITQMIQTTYGHQPQLLP